MDAQEFARLFVTKSVTKEDAIKAGRSAAEMGPNTDNCHFKYFATPELKSAWEYGHLLGQKPPAKGA